jgi:hypothetical protein
MQRGQGREKGRQGRTKVTDRADGYLVRPPACSYPDCPSHFIGDKLIAELKVIQENQIKQEELQKKMYDQQVVNAKIQQDLIYIKDDLNKIDGRIIEAFRIILLKPDKDDIYPKEALITKSDAGKLIAYTAGLFTLIVGVLELIMQKL